MAVLPGVSGVLSRPPWNTLSCWILPDWPIPIGDGGRQNEWCQLDGIQVAGIGCVDQSGSDRLDRQVRADEVELATLRGVAMGRGFVLPR